ncbi:MAG TPA: ATP-grasp domain-containing protein [Nitrososphaeraceae archaeon]|jgi:carbamoyl-phosphate synthase large subunit
MNNRIQLNVLVTAAGGIIGEGIIKCLNWANLSSNEDSIFYRIFAADANTQAAGLYRCNGMGFLVPTSSSPDYIDNIISITKRNDINAIFVGSDEELLVLGEFRSRIEAETNAKIISNPLTVLELARDKWKTYEFLANNNFSRAESSLPDDKRNFISRYGFPLVVKPREGYGSLHFAVVKDENELAYNISKIEEAGWKPMLQEYLGTTGTEYTTGVTIDKRGIKILSSISIQKAIKHGQTYKAIIDNFHEVRKPAEDIALKIGGRGPINVQAMRVGDEVKVFEINPRFSATCPMRAVAGINEPDIILRNLFMNQENRAREYKKLLCMRYWNEVFVDYSTYVHTSSERIVKESNSLVPNYF